ncbi:MAG: hypothetical protein [Bacteriophage sp.]|uniref:hypothetical protein n=1 Tax=Megamonas sp. TaxID=2049033 RepID=UPI0021FD6995|nr:hypothetical protein [Megamonas sp.]UVX36173.1 MAG: hypothetical protein [Bacteriophage sp.]UVX40328.1 MAG: hypothetical protein [Bacteriophage sp.]UWI03235.1 MAG: hypothetical protein [Bacteriophage sp.]
MIKGEIEMKEIDERNKKAANLYVKLSEEQQKQIYWIMQGYVISNGASITEVIKDKIAS